MYRCVLFVVHCVVLYDVFTCCVCVFCLFVFFWGGVQLLRIYVIVSFLCGLLCEVVCYVFVLCVAWLCVSMRLCLCACLRLVV